MRRNLFYSIKGRLLFWLLLITSAVLVIRGFSVYHEIKMEVLQLTENDLHSKIQILKGLLYEERGGVRLHDTEILSGEYSIPRSGHYYKILVDGKVLDTSASLPYENFDLAAGRKESYDEELRESVYLMTGPARERIMVLRHDFEIIGLPVTIFAAKDLEKSYALIQRFKHFFLISIPLNILLVAFLGLWVAKNTLKPLKAFSSRIEAITHTSLDERLDTAFLAEEIKSLAQAFNAMLDKLQDAFQAERRFIADASHELKTPLTVIKTQCEVLLRKERTAEEYAAALTTIRGASEGMQKKVSDMLSLARLDSGFLSSSRHHAVSLSACLTNAIQLAGAIAEKNGVRIIPAFSNTLMVTGSENSLTEAFLNIIENAVKYNHEGGTVEISVVTGEIATEVIICDSGMGIEQSHLHRIFDRFFRVDTQRKSEGTGLGLSIAKAIIEAHNGKIRVDSLINKGSCFTIVLPAHHG